MRDFFFQIVLFLAGLVLGIVVPFLPDTGKKWLVGVLSVLLIVFSLVWVGYELGIREISPSVIVGATSDTPTLVATPIVPTVNSDSSTNPSEEKLSTATISPTPTDTPKIAVSGWDAEVAAEFASLRRQPDLSSTAIIALNKGDGVELLAINANRLWVQARSNARTGWLPLDKLNLNISLDALEIKEIAVDSTQSQPTSRPQSQPTPEEQLQTDTIFTREYAGTKLAVYLAPDNANWANSSDLVDEFTNQTGIEIEVIDAPASSTENFNQQQQFLNSGSTNIDVYQIDVIWPAMVAEHAVDLYQYIPQKELDLYFPKPLENNTVNDRLVAVPWFQDVGLLYYRTDLLEEYGYGDPPKTWTELETMAATIQGGQRSKGYNNFWGFVWQGNNYEGLTSAALEWQVSEGGGQIIELNGRITINNPASVAAIERAARWIGSISPTEVTSYQEEDARSIWQAGNAAFMRNWPYAYDLGNASNSPIRNQFEVTALPAGSANLSAGTLGGWGLMVSRYSNNVEAAALFVRYMTAYETQKDRLINKGYLPTIIGLYADREALNNQPVVGKMLDAFNYSVARPSTIAGDKYADVSAAYFNAVHDILAGRINASASLANLERELVNITGFQTGAP